MQRRNFTFSRRTKVLGALLGLVVLLSGCIKYEGVITIQDDGSGTVDVLTAIDPEAFNAFGDLGGDLGTTDDICDDFSSDLTSPSDLPSGASIQPYNEDGLCGARVQFALEPSQEHSDDLADVLDPSTRIYKQGDNWFFESDFSADEITGEAEGFGDDVVGDLFGNASFTITVDLPGRALAGENNATNVGDDGRFTWDIDILNPPARLFAQTEPGSGGGTGGGGGISPILIGVIIAALLGAAGLFWFMKNRNGSSSDTMADTPQPVGDPPMPNPAPAPGSAGTMPVGDGPSIDATPPSPMPVRPEPGEMKETVVMNAGDLGTDDASSIPTPEYDATLGAWVVKDPARGRLRHDPETDTWIPIP